MEARRIPRSATLAARCLAFAIALAAAGMVARHDSLMGASVAAAAAVFTFSNSRLDLLIAAPVLLSHSPYEFGAYCGPLAYVPFFWAVRCRMTDRTALVRTSCVLGYSQAFCTIPWIAHDASFAAPLLFICGTMLSLLWFIATLCIARVLRQPEMWRILLCSGVIPMLEYVRVQNPLISLPYACSYDMVAKTSGFVQLAEFCGAFGLSYLVCLFSCSLALIPSMHSQARRIWATAWICCFATCFILGAYRQRWLRQSASGSEVTTLLLVHTTEGSRELGWTEFEERLVRACQHVNSSAVIVLPEYALVNPYGSGQVDRTVDQLYRLLSELDGPQQAITGCLWEHSHDAYSNVALYLDPDSGTKQVVAAKQFPAPVGEAPLPWPLNGTTSLLGFGTVAGEFRTWPSEQGTANLRDLRTAIMFCSEHLNPSIWRARGIDVRIVDVQLCLADTGAFGNSEFERRASRNMQIIHAISQRRPFVYCGTQGSCLITADGSIEEYNGEFAIVTLRSHRLAQVDTGFVN